MAAVAGRSEVGGGGWRGAASGKGGETGGDGRRRDERDGDHPFADKVNSKGSWDGGWREGRGGEESGQASHKADKEQSQEL